MEDVMHMGKKDFLIISNLRRNARESLTKISKSTGIPVSTIFDRLRLHESGLIKKHTAIVDFARLGFATRASIMLRAKKDDKSPLREYLSKQENVNSIYRINNNFDYMVEGIFKDIKDLEEFLERLEEKFSIEEKEIHYIVDEIKKEEFMSRPECLGFFV